MGFVSFALLMTGLSVGLVRLAITAGLYASEEGLRVQRLFRSETILWREIGNIATQVPERWAVLQRGTWGNLILNGTTPEIHQRMFVAEMGVGISTGFSAKGLRELAKLLLQRVSPEVWASDPEARRWLTEQAEGTGPFMSRLI
ncbi:MAG TPA: hypothetical protein VFF77_02745 [Holophagaceae bacterium]|nr:hypothetical protein [Holophagaceae bacterium]